MCPTVPVAALLGVAESGVGVGAEAAELALPLAAEGDGLLR
jgi:hypothetical protein